VGERTADLFNMAIYAGSILLIIIGMAGMFIAGKIWAAEERKERRERRACSHRLSDFRTYDRPLRRLFRKRLGYSCCKCGTFLPSEDVKLDGQ
jgi:uncharacterized protein (DUF2461 family)